MKKIWWRTCHTALSQCGTRTDDSPTAGSKDLQKDLSFRRFTCKVHAVSLQSSAPRSSAPQACSAALPPSCLRCRPPCYRHRRARAAHAVAAPPLAMWRGSALAKHSHPRWTQSNPRAGRCRSWSRCYRCRCCVAVGHPPCSVADGQSALSRARRCRRRRRLGSCRVAAPPPPYFCCCCPSPCPVFTRRVI